MKFKLTYLIITLGIITSTVANAKNDPREKELLRVAFKSSGVVNLIYTAPIKSNPTVSIIDASKTIVFSEKISNNYGVLRTYNISALPEGEYFFEVVDKGVKTVKGITYKKEVVNTASNLKIDVTPTGTGKFNLVCKGVAKQDVFVSIYSKTQGTIFEDFIDSKSDFSRTYDLSKLNSDDYVFEVSSSSQTVAKEVSLEKAK